MATIREKSLRLVVYGNDHPPPHAYVLGPGWEIRIALTDPPSLLSLGGDYKTKDITSALAATYANLERLRQLWNENHD